MEVFDLDGNRVKWTPKGKEVVLDTRPRSALHKTAREVLKAKFPTLQLMEEVPFNPRRGKTLYFDFYLPLRNMAIEVHGEQHYNYSSLFHRTRMDFINQRKNDADKREWCETNNITLLVLPYDEQPWSDIIK